MNSEKGPRRVVTGHDETGKAIVAIDGITPHRLERPQSSSIQHLLWMTDRAPAVVTGHSDTAGDIVGIAPPAGGSGFRIIDFLPIVEEAIEKLDPQYLSKQIPNEASALAKHRPSTHPYMHYTRTIDYAIVLSGEIVMKLDEEEVHLKQGDVVIQRATNHAWINRSGKVCRMAFVIIDANEPL